VFGNRFIKLFWHSKEQQAANPPAPVNSFEQSDSSNGADGGEQPRKSIKDRLAQRAEEEPEVERHPITDRNLLKKSNLEKKVEVPKQVENVQAPLVKTRSEKKVDKIRNTVKLQKSRQTLIEGYLQAQKLLLDKMAKATKKKEKDDLMIELKEYSGKIKELELKVKSDEFFIRKMTGIGPLTSQLISNTRHQHAPAIVRDEKEVLDLELDNMIGKQE